MQQQNNVSSQVEHKPCNHKQMNRKFTNLCVSIQFAEQLPIKIQPCLLTVEQLQHQLVENHLHHDPEAHKVQQFILIQYHHQSSNYKFDLLLPMEHILCVAKKSAHSTLLMVKDKEKQIQRDQEGYELVSDEQDGEEEFVEKKNLLYERIRSILSAMYEGNGLLEQELQGVDEERKVVSVKLEQKCTILLSFANQHQNHTSQQQSTQLYSYLSKKLEDYEKLNAKQTSANSWKDSIQQFEGFGGMGYGQVGMDDEEQDYSGEDQDMESDEEQQQEKDMQM